VGGLGAGGRPITNAPSQMQAETKIRFKVIIYRLADVSVAETLSIYLLSTNHELL